MEHEITLMTFLLLVFVNYRWKKTNNPVQNSVFWDVIVSLNQLRLTVYPYQFSFLFFPMILNFRLPCQLALFLLERSPPQMNCTAALLEFPGVMTECLTESLGYVNLHVNKKIMIISKFYLKHTKHRCVAPSLQTKHCVESKPSTDPV